MRGCGPSASFTVEVYQIQPNFALHSFIMVMYNIVIIELTVWGGIPMHDEPNSFENERFPSPYRPFVANLFHYARSGDSGVNIHEGLEVGVTIRGCMDFNVDRYTFSALPGEAWLMGMWEPHRWHVTQPNTLVVSILFIPEFLGNEMIQGTQWQPMFMCPPAARPMSSKADLLDQTLAIGHEMKSEIEQRKSGWQIAIRLNLAKLLLLLWRNWEPQSQGQAPRIQNNGTFDRIMPALAIVRSQPSQRLNLREAAAKCGLSPAQFSRVFAQTMGLSYGVFRTRAHLAYAAQLLLETDFSIETIAQKAGFTDASHLHRYFVKYYERTPGQFRLINR